MIDFAFELAIGAAVNGKGLITWANSGGMVGVAFHYLRGQGKDHFQSWLTERQRVSSQPLPADDGT